MRKLKGFSGYAAFMAMIIMILLLNTSTASAADVNVQVWTIGISINDMRTQGSSKAVFYNSDVFVPVKYLSSSMKMSYVYNNADGMISLKSNSPLPGAETSSLGTMKTGGGIAVKIWTVAINIDGKRASGNAQAVFYGGDIFVPARYLSKNLRLEYAYSDKDGMIRLKSTIMVPAPTPTPAPTPAPTPVPTPAPTQVPVPAPIAVFTTEAVAANSSHVVLLKNMDASGIVSSIGSGFIISTDGQIVTNYHVVDGASSMTATLQDGRVFSVESVLAYDKVKDLAILKATGLFMERALTFGDASTVIVGAQVVAIGNPEGLSNTVSTGIISSVRFSAERNANDFQTTAPISHGSSGGPLFNMKGEVIGINYAGYSEGQNLNFAIPVSDLIPLMAGLSPKSFAQVQQEVHPIVSVPTPVSDVPSYFYEVESNNDISRADVVDNSFSGGVKYAINGTITGFNNDLDCFGFFVPAGGTFEIHAFWSSGSRHWEKGYEDDLIVGLLDGNGTVMAASRLIGSGATAQQQLSFRVSPGTYYIVVLTADNQYRDLYINEPYVMFVDLVR